MPSYDLAIVNGTLVGAGRQFKATIAVRDGRIADFYGPGESLAAERTIEECLEQGVRELKLLQEHIHDNVGKLVADRTGRRPMILPVVVEV